MLKTILLCILLLLNACSTNSPTTQSNNEPKQKLGFIDIGNFDLELSSSLNSQINSVDVMFYEKVSPNKIPERLQKWIAAVERSGGHVKVETPPNEPTPRSALTLLSLLGTAYSTIKNHIASQPESFLSSTKGRNAVISLERGANGELLVEKVRFVKWHRFAINPFNDGFINPWLRCFLLLSFVIQFQRQRGDTH